MSDERLLALFSVCLHTFRDLRVTPPDFSSMSLLLALFIILFVETLDCLTGNLHVTTLSSTIEFKKISPS